MEDSTKAILYVIMAVFFIIASIFTFHWLPVIMVVVSVVATGYYSTKPPREYTYNADGKILEKIKAENKKAKVWNAKLENTNAFCENCGNTLNPKAKFCGSCGTART